MGLAQPVQRAVDSDLDLKLAAARVEEARAVRGIEKSALRGVPDWEPAEGLEMFRSVSSILSSLPAEFILLVDEQKAKVYDSPMDEGRKRVVGIIAGILVARHLRTTEDLFDSKPSPRTESLIASAVQWAERIMRKIDAQCTR
jgi:hypothetical protein